MAKQYNKKLESLEEIVETQGFDDEGLLHRFIQRVCQPPFSRAVGASALWLDLWSLMDTEGREEILEMPDPCLKHVESRLRKPDRAANLRLGLNRLLRHDQRLFVEALRLYPHALCRAAETIGPLDQSKWEGLETDLGSHRLWQVKPHLTEDEFWETAEHLEDYRDLPQAVLDYLDLDRPREQAPVEEFEASLQRFVVRERVEKIRHSTYEILRSHNIKPVVEVGSNS